MDQSLKGEAWRVHKHLVELGAALRRATYNVEQILLRIEEERQQMNLFEGYVDSDPVGGLAHMMPGDPKDHEAHRD